MHQHIEITPPVGKRVSVAYNHPPFFRVVVVTMQTGPRGYFVAYDPERCAGGFPVPESHHYLDILDWSPPRFSAYPLTLKSR